MLDRAGDQVPASGGFERLGGAANREVVALGAAGGEDDLGRLAAEQGGHLGARLVERGLGLLAEVVHARRVAPDVANGPVHPVGDRGASGVVAL